MSKERRIQDKERIIKRRMKIVKEVWRCPNHPYILQPNRLNKINLACPCRQCRAGDPDLQKYKKRKRDNSI